jgi:hypothetical protein
MFLGRHQYEITRGDGAKSSISSNCRDKILQINLRVERNIDGSYLVILYRLGPGTHVSEEASVWDNEK